MNGTDVNNSENSNINNEVQTIESFKDRLIKNKIYFETIGILSLTLMGIIVSFESCQISKSQLALDRIQTKVILAEQKSTLVLGGIDSEKDGSKYSYIYADGHIYDALVLMEDNIYVTFEDGNKNEVGTVMFNVVGRYVNPQSEYKDNNVLFTIIEDKNGITPEKFVERIDDYCYKNQRILTSKVSYSKKISFCYNDYNGNPCTETYYLINDNTYMGKYDDEFVKYQPYDYSFTYDVTKDNINKFLENAMNKISK